MTAPDRDPLTIAREVIRQHGDLDRDALSLRERERLTLARAVVAVATLADELSEAGRESYQEGLNDAGDAYQAATLLIHAALNGAPDA